MKQRILLFSLLCLFAMPARPAPAGPDPSTIAEEEALRRQERKIVLDSNLARAKDLQKKKEYATAAKLYEETIGHAKLLGGVQNVEKQYADALAGLTECRIQLATVLQEKYQFKEADAEVNKVFAFDPASAKAQAFKRFNDHVEAAHRGRLPSAQVVTKAAELMENRSKVMSLVRDGKMYYEVGEFKEARARLEEAIQKDPMNDAAFFYLRMIMEAQFEQESRLREKTYVESVVAVTEKWNQRGRTSLGVSNPYYKTNSQPPFLTHSSPGAQAINRKLDEIIFPEINYPDLVLPEVLKDLDEKTKKYDLIEKDPGKKGLNFLINNVISDYISANAQAGAGGGAAAAAAAPQVLDPVTGQPIAAAATGTQKPDMDSVTIKVSTVLRNLTLRQVLDVICKTADVKMPDGRSAGLKYSIEEYAIVFSPKLPEQASMFSRMFKVNPDTFVQGLQSVVGNPIQAVTSSGGGAGGAGGGGTQGGGLGGLGGGGGGAGGQQGSGFVVAGVSVAGQSQGGGGGGGGTGGGLLGVTSTNLTADANNQVRQYFIAAGVVNLGVTNGPDATQVFFNDRNGLLLVRASLQDLDIIQMAIELLNVIPPQVLVESRFAEINQNDNKALGFDLAWGNTVLGPTAIQGNLAPSLTGRVSPANPTGVFPLSGAPALSTSSITDGLRNNAPAVATLTGILTDPQFRMVIRAIEQRDGTDVLAAPKVITVSGRQAQIQVTDVQLILTGITPGQTAGGGGGAVGGGVGGAAGAGGGIGAQLAPQVQPLPTGPVLDVLPTVAADGYTINMSLIPSITQFVGYDAVPPEFAGAIQVQSVGSGTVGVPLTAQVPLPRTRIRQVVTQCVVWDAQTVMLGGLISEDIQNTKDKVPVLGDLPLVGRLFRSETKTNRKKNLMIFVTPTIIDPAGNRVHTDAEMPFIPPQVSLVGGQ